MHAQLSLILQNPFIQPGHALVGTRAHQLRKAQGDFLLGMKVQGQAQRLFAVRQREAMSIFCKSAWEICRSTSSASACSILQARSSSISRGR